MRKPQSSLSVLLLLNVIVAEKCYGSSVGTGGLSVSPVNHLDASVAASAAHASVAAVRSVQNEQEYVVIVSFKPSSESSGLLMNQEKPTVTKRTRKFGLTLADINGADDTGSSSRWTPMGASAICTMTGFAADIQHLTGVTLNKVERHQSLYSQGMTVDRIVSTLAAPVQRAARSQGSRPYGIQALMVGLDSDGTFQLYTVDPSGGWQHYGGGATAIGRGAQTVRAELYKSLKKETMSEDGDTSYAALKIAISSLVGNDMEDDDSDYTNKLEALLVWKSKSGTCCVSRIDDSEIDACVKLLKEKP